ncbi:type VI secretion system protein ImpA [Burkholderia ubonensis]|uniref:type VI secretion system protein TssA n=1 Tax=Burkholderia ubonensis TaxID=101571 RepID=UPI0007538213|nr:type VI secretion system protein TssA [Burkholderia ubonensis]KVP81061.1 type VI secretion system protein ImpA [Burkholderia ubonensis]
MGMSVLPQSGSALQGARIAVDDDALASLGRIGIDPATSAGADVRGDARFDALQAELAKLASPSASGQVDWGVVATLATELLRDKGKDLLIGCYLAGALLQIGGPAGLQCGLDVVGDLIEYHWDAMSPPASRMRARRGALQWLLDRVDAMRSVQLATCSYAYPATLIEQLHTAVRRIDALMAARDSDAPTMRALRAFADQLPVEPDANDGADSSGAEDVSDPTDEAPARVADAYAEPVSSESAGRPAQREVVDTFREAASLDDAATRERSLDDALVQLHRIATALAQADWTDARSFRLRRFASWFGVHMLPDTEADCGRTYIAAPNAQVVDVAKRIGEQGEPADAICFAEQQAQAFPLWLDLQRIAAHALARAGGGCAGAQHEVEVATRTLLERLPGLDMLKFADGTPFADDATRAWLAELSASIDSVNITYSPVLDEPSRTRNDAPKDCIDDSIDRIRSIAAGGRLDQALRMIQGSIDRAPSAADRLRARIRLCELVRDHWPHEIPDTFARSVIEPIQRHDLAAWDSELALEGLTVAYALLIRHDRDSARAQAVFDDIASIDAAEAMRLGFVRNGGRSVGCRRN